MELPCQGRKPIKQLPQIRKIIRYLRLSLADGLLQVLLGVAAGHEALKILHLLLCLTVSRLELLGDPAVLVLELVQCRQDSFELTRFELLHALHTLQHVVHLPLGFSLFPLLVVELGLELAKHVLKLVCIRRHLIKLLKELRITTPLILLCLLKLITKML